MSAKRHKPSYARKLEQARAPSKRGYQVRHVVREFLKDQARQTREPPALTDFRGE